MCGSPGSIPGGSTSVNPLVTISVDGVSIPSFTPENNSVGGVTHVSVRFGDNSGVREDDRQGQR